MESQNTLLDDVMLRALRVLYLEFIWPAFPWIESICIREKNSKLQLFVQMSESQNEAEWDDLASVPKNCGYRELMSNRLFKKLAKRLAPSRLEIGR